VRRVALFVLFTVALVSSAGLCQTSLRVVFFDVGQGDAILLDYGAIEVLIDAGPAGDWVAELDEYVEGPLEVVVVTHPHADHIGGVDEVLRRFDVLEVVTSGATATSEAYADFTSAVSAEAPRTRTVRRNDTISVRGVELHVLNPSTLTGNANEDSIVLRLNYGAVSFLFTGDIGTSTETALQRGGCLSPVTVLKVAHHGSAYGTSQAFLGLCRPLIAVYSAGLGNRYDHPATSTLDRLAGAGTQIYGTDDRGTICVATDGERVWPLFATSSPSPMPADGAASCAACLSRLNSTTMMGFDVIGGIGEVTSAALVAAQLFNVTACGAAAIEAALDAVDGIGVVLRQRITRQLCPELYDK